jgi:hypothetical protein
MHAVSRRISTVNTLWPVLVVFALACGPSTVSDSNIKLEALTLSGWQYPTMMPGSRLRITGGGFLAPELGNHTLTIKGLNVLVTVPLVRIAPNTLEYVVDDLLLAQMPPNSPAVEAVLTVKRVLTETQRQDEAAFAATIQVVNNLVPKVTKFDSPGGVLYPGDVITIKGDGFLTEGEGNTVLVIKGTFESIAPPETRVVQPVIPITGTDRQTIELVLTPDIFGLLPGTFVGVIQVTNETPFSALPGKSLTGLVRQLLPPRIDAVLPSVVSRGQLLTASGRGFLHTDPFYETTTLIRAEGEFSISQTSETLTLAGPTALALFPDLFHGNEAMDYVLRVSMTPSGDLEGLGLMIGSFNGVISPLLIAGTETITGTGAHVSLVIAPQRQIVFINFLPGFSATLEEMGLGLVETQIRTRILDVCARDYLAINIEFRSERPTDYVEYSVIEVGGADPNQAGLFGLDNTAGKDVGNLRFNDIIGGTNAESREDGFYAFGGVFVRSFLQLSPTLYGAEALPIASPRFDQIFGPFMPAMSGKPIETTDFGGPLQPWIDGAVWSLGNLIGSTVSHEIGHSLGLANYEGQFHNPTDQPNAIMDAGNFRPFQERAEIDGYGPAQFNDNNRTYLQRILPID